MRLSIMGALVLAACVGAGTARADTVAINMAGPINPPGGAVPFNYTQGSYLTGFVFRANSAISITQLGFYDSNLTNVPETFVSSPVGVYDMTMNTLVTSAMVLPSAPATGLFRYVSISPVTLNTSHTYAIVGVTGTNYYTVGVQASGAPANAAITYVSTAYYTTGTTTLVEPNTFSQGNIFGNAPPPGTLNDFGPNFQFTAGAVPPPTITINGVSPNDSSATTIEAGEWVSIYGVNLAGASATWNNNFPTSLGGTSVTIDGRQGYLWYVSPTQINLQAPNDTALGPVTVVVTTPNGTASSTVTLAQFAPSFSLLDSKHVAGIIPRSNGSGAYAGGSYDIVGPTGTGLGYATVAAKAGDTVELFGVGFGPTSPPVAAGAIFSGSAPTTNAVSLRINNVSVIPSFSGLSAAGLYQINFTVPAGLGTGDVALVATVGGVSAQPSVVISLQ
ncbi:MAG TPA: IPT/TIG domain-containing protein [Bryobacteraceae bacterium]|nr:IPT/TIG domain-containing protein [Bryobacteraceae bacterium]